MGEMAVVEGPAVVRSSASAIDALVDQMETIQLALGRAMTRDVHYGPVPGTDKPTLLKPGAEKLCVLFRLAPEFESVREWHGEHLTVTARCRLTHIPTGDHVATAEGLCSTMESKYRYRNANRACPVCGAEAIIKGKEQYGGGWLCWKKRDGCGATFADDDQRITGQTAGKVENDNLPDLWNTVLKMAEKRALVAAVLGATAASDVFTQDVGDDEKPEPQEPQQPARPPLPTSWAAGTELYDRIVGVPGSLAEWVGLVAQAEYGATEAAELEKAQKDAVFLGVRSVIEHLLVHGADVDTVCAAWDSQFEKLAETGWEPVPELIVAGGESA